MCQLAKAQKRIEELELQLRWRKWPEEKPEVVNKYWVWATIGGFQSAHYDGKRWNRAGVTWWLPIPPMGEE